MDCLDFCGFILMFKTKVFKSCDLMTKPRNDECCTFKRFSEKVDGMITEENFLS